MQISNKTIQTNLVKMTALLGISLFLSGCLTNEFGSMLAGGIAGGLIGNQFGKNTGRTASTIAGAMVGSWTGNQWGQSVDRAMLRTALLNPDDLYPYSNSIEPTYYSDKYHRKVYRKKFYSHSHQTFKKCRHYQSAVWINGEPEPIDGKVCLINGKWQIVG